jgi:murein DD-endopeptidase MepM/ murein hydrolase activator NlpD
MQAPWTIVVAHQDPAVPVRCLSFGRPALVVLCLFVAGGLGGLSRIAYVAAKYGYSRMGVAQEERRHDVLQAKIRFLGRLAQQRVRLLDSLALFEDAVRLKYGMNTISEEIRRAGVGGRPDAEEMVTALLRGPAVRSADSVKDDIQALLRRVGLQNTTFAQVSDQYGRQHERLAQRPSTWPVHGRITSYFGERVHPFTGYTCRHEGLDIANQEWTPVFATADGIVAYVGRKEYYGNTVDIDHHGNGFSTRFAHMVQSAVVEGQVLRRGDLVGYMGSTGRSTGTHLHYEIREVNKPVNPIDLIVPTDVVVD